VQTLLDYLIQDGKLQLDLSDEIVHGTTIVHNGTITHEPTLAALSLSAPPSQEVPT
jgi:hypothetical protein